MPTMLLFCKRFFRYTYGKAVDGKVTVVVSNPSVTHWGYDRNYRRLPARTVELKDLAVSLYSLWFSAIKFAIDSHIA